jgi:myosin heavy subunit
LQPQELDRILTPDVSQASEAEVVSKEAFQQCESAVNQLTDLARLEFNALRTELDGKLKGLDDQMRKCEQRAIAAEEKSRILASHLESNKRVISNLNEQIAVANENAQVVKKERKVNAHRVSDLEQQLRHQDAELAAAKAKANQANERLMNLWSAMEKSRSSMSRKRKEASEPPAFMGAGDGGNAKRACKTRGAYIGSEHGHDGHSELDVPSAHGDEENPELSESSVSIRLFSLPVVKTEERVCEAISKQAVQRPAVLTSYTVITVLWVDRTRHGG